MTASAVVIDEYRIIIQNLKMFENHEKFENIFGCVSPSSPAAYALPASTSPREHTLTRSSSRKSQMT